MLIGVKEIWTMRRNRLDRPDGLRRGIDLYGLQPVLLSVFVKVCTHSHTFSMEGVLEDLGDEEELGTKWDS